MSSVLKWRRAIPPPPFDGGCGLPFKATIVRRFWDEHADGTLSYHDPVIVKLEEHEQWLLGVIAASSDGGELKRQAMHFLEDLREFKQLEIIVE